MKLDPEDTAAAVRRLRRAHGQLGGVLRMLDEGADCEATVTQLAAVSKALDRAGFALITSGLQQCFTRDDDEATLDRARLEKLFLSLA